MGSKRELLNQYEHIVLYLQVIEEKVGVCQLEDKLFHLQAQVQHSCRVLNRPNKILVNSLDSKM